MIREAGPPTRYWNATDELLRLVPQPLGDKLRLSVPSESMLLLMPKVDQEDGSKQKPWQRLSSGAR
ncbi:hypothetical protein ACFSYD_21325 [Paracoccus aerius]